MAALLTLSEAGRRTGHKWLSIKHWCATGLPHVCIGNRIKVIEADVRAWVEKRGRAKRKLIPLMEDHRGGFIYALFDPRDMRIRYIGKTVRPVQRRAEYRKAWREGTGHNPHLARWLAKLSREGVEPRFEILDQVDADLLEREEMWIAVARLEGWPITNCTTGGESSQPSEEMKAKIAAGSRANWQTDEYKARWLASRARALEAAERTRAHKMGVSLEEYRAFKAERKQQHEGNRKQWLENVRLHDERKAARLNKQIARCIRVDGDIAYVPLTNGQEATIDTEDVLRIGAQQWYAAEHLGRWRAQSNGRTADGKPCRLLLNRFVVGASGGEMVVYRDGNSLNCRKTNLALISQKSGRPMFASR